jgi:two-component system response regulator AtoC
MRLLLVEDELAQRQTLTLQLSELGHEVVAVETGGAALEQLDGDEFDLVVADLHLPDFDAIELIRRAKQSGSVIPILVITAYASVESAVTALQVGATDYLVKPIHVSDLERRMQQIYDLDHLRRENRMLRRLIQSETSKYWFPETAAGRKVQELIAKVGNTDLTVLITGESGTGKGMTARLLHSVSPRSGGSFVNVNCAAIPEGLLESELFGYVKGAFTGAEKSREGLFAAASGGTLFLDEISGLTPPMQAKLLHAIEDKSVRQVGSTKDRRIDVLIIVATNRDLEKMVEEGSFREDLRFRLDVFHIPLPPLREQKEALTSAVAHFLVKHQGRRPGPPVTISSEVWDRFFAYEWPGNLRELEITLERALLLCDDGTITPADLPPSLQFSSSGGATAQGTLKERVEAFERLTILQTLEQVGGDRRRAAEVLGTSLSTIYRKLEEAHEEA